MWVTLYGAKQHHKLFETLAENRKSSALHTPTQGFGRQKAAQRPVSIDINLQFAQDACQPLKMRNCQLVKKAVLHVVRFATWCDDNGIKINAGSVIGLGKLGLNIHMGPHTAQGFSHRRGDICLQFALSRSSLGARGRGCPPIDLRYFIICNNTTQELSDLYWELSELN
jgi:hypothetical protein